MLPPIPRKPVLSWAALRGSDSGKSNLPSLLDRAGPCLTTSGSAALLHALRVLGVSAGDAVLVPTYHCPTMVAPVVCLGAQPVFYAIDAEGSPNMEWLDGMSGPTPRAMIAAHFFGWLRPMDKLRQWCDRHGVALIEDCAHTLFGQAGTQPVGSWGDVAIASLTKFLPLPEGGLLVSNRPLTLPRLREPGLATEMKTILDILDASARVHRLPAANGLVLELLGRVRALRPQAAGGAQDGPPDDAAATPTAANAAARPGIPGADRALTRTGRWLANHLPRARNIDQRQRHFQQFAQGLNGQAGLHPLRTVLPTGCAPYVFPLWVDQPDPGYVELRRLGLPIFRWNAPWPGTPKLPGDHGALWSHHVLQLLCHQELSESDITRTINAVLSLYARPVVPIERAPTVQQA